MTSFFYFQNALLHHKNLPSFQHLMFWGVCTSVLKDEGCCRSFIKVQVKKETSYISNNVVEIHFVDFFLAHDYPKTNELR